MFFSTSHFVYREAWNAVPALIDDGLKREDLERLERNFYGALQWPVDARAPRRWLFAGARSGLEALSALIREPDAEVVVIEPDACRRRLLRTPLQARGRCEFYESFAAMVVGSPGLDFSFVRVDGEALPPTAAALSRLRADHLCGSYRASDIDTMNLYRLCRDKVCRSFFWRETETKKGCGRAAAPVAPFEVSVVVPAYKVENEIETCIESLAYQTLKSLDIVVVNDGSPDATADKARRVAEAFPGRVRVLDKPNGGCASARMFGLAHSKAEYVGFVDGDDWVLPGMFEELYCAAVSGSSDIAQCGYKEVFPDGSEIVERDKFGVDEPHRLTGVIEGPIHLATMRPTIWRRIHRRAFLEANQIAFPVHIPRFDDLPFQFEVFARAGSIAIIPDALYCYRQGRSLQDLAADDERLFVHFDLFDYIDRKVMSWANFEAEEMLIQCELNTHLWALSRIQKRLSGAYSKRALRHFARERVHHTKIDMLGFARRLHGQQRRFLLRSLCVTSRKAISTF